MRKRKIAVLGGDGFCGWPASLHLSRNGYDVTIIDNFSRRAIDEELGCGSLVPIQPLETRILAWNDLKYSQITFKNVDIAKNYYGLVDVLRKLRPDAVIHFAEQRAAPYSMKSPLHKRYTVTNNTQATHNLLCALVELSLNTHVVHLGTMGVYGYGVGGITLPEGYVQCHLIDPRTGDTQQAEIYYPTDPGSIYHMTKVLDANLFYYYNKNDDLRITDLHQGIVWGVSTDETEMGDSLANRFDYDGDYGTVLNRFLVQAVLGHPLTVHGTGGQTRAFIHIQNMVECIKLAVENPPEFKDPVKVWNQTTEQLNILDLANLVSKLTGAQIRLYRNPRLEASENSLVACMDNIHSLGLSPVYLSEDEMTKVCTMVYKYKDRVNLSKIPCVSTWRKDREEDREGVGYETEEVENS